MLFRSLAHRSVAAPERGHLLRLESIPYASAACGDVRVGGNHRCRSFMDGGDDLGVVDPAQVSGGDR